MGRYLRTLLAALGLAGVFQKPLARRQLVSVLKATLS